MLTGIQQREQMISFLLNNADIAEKEIAELQKQNAELQQKIEELKKKVSEVK